MYSTNCTSASNVSWAPVAGVLVVSLTVHAIAPAHNLGPFQLPPQEHTELSSKSTPNVDNYVAGFALLTSASTLPSTSLTVGCLGSGLVQRSSAGSLSI